MNKQNKQRHLSLFLWVLITLFPLLPLSHGEAQETYQSLCLRTDWESLPILQGGRVKPLLVQAKETLKFLTQKTQVGDYPATAAYCLLSLQPLKAFDPTLPSLDLEVPIGHVKVKALLGLPENAKSFPLKELAGHEGKIRAELQKTKLKDSFYKELEKLFSQLHLYQELIAGKNWTLFSSSSSSSWKTLSVYLDEGSATSLSPGQLKTLLENSKSFYLSQESDKYLLELTYVKMNLFSWAILLVILSLAAFVLFKNRRAGLLLAFLSLAVQVTAVTLRVLISGRAPITNMYETVMFSGMGSLVLAMGLAFIRKEKFFLLAGLAYNLCCLFMITFANNMLSPSISPLVPVLRDNFWLSTHVTMVILSYAALALSWILSNYVLIRKRWNWGGSLTNQEFLYYNSLIYSCIKCGVVLLAGGVILGGVWADYSWGRFWGWDPKETWSLIALLIYMAILHGKSTNWIPPHRFVLCTAGAFMSVMMAWFGVNFILASGLHSYGFSQGGAFFLGAFFLVQIFVLLVTGIGPSLGKSKNNSSFATGGKTL